MCWVDKGDVTSQTVSVRRDGKTKVSKSPSTEIAVDRFCIGF